MSKRILVILGHPHGESLCAALAQAYVQGATEAGHEVRFVDVAALNFDPILHHGYRRIQELEPDLLAVQQSILWAQHLVFVYPIWWGAMPALLKGLIDRIFLPGFAFKYRENSVFWDRLLTGRSAHLLTTMDTPPWYFRWVNRMPGHNQMRRTILGFCGIKPMKITNFSPVRYADESKRARWLEQVRGLGRKA